ncbi:biotin-dependent carboxyltransferase family protein [Limnohabitans sp. Rim8]|uniref:5-oxoprolinase subunit C family protein n=1 Tax=Limnohabitans sp. Rim8 TaxID=1100718 RepID=UPI003306499C
MAESLLKVISSGPLVSYQDAGRFGMMRFGVPASGPMDRLGYAAALAALGFERGNTTIEISMGGVALQCESGEVSFSIAGGGFQVRHAGALAPSWCVRTLRSGETLVVRPGLWGSWAYIAFAGDLDCSSWAGHSATHAASNLGGGLIKSGDVVKVRNAEVIETREGDLPVPEFARSCSVAHVVLGPQSEYFQLDAIKAFSESIFSVSASFDRMGMQLVGPGLELKNALSIPSEPLVRGSVQVSGNGMASVLLSDHQTTGGYPKIATLISSDIDALAQLRPSERIRFKAVSAEDAIGLVRLTMHSRQKYLQSIALPRMTLDQRLMSENLISGAV